MIAHLDCTTGISGDKFLGALLDAARELAGDSDALFSESHVEQALRSVAPEASLRLERVRCGGIAALSVHVVAEGGSPGRRFGEVRAAIESARVPDSARERAIEAFRLLAEAEGAVHGVAPEDVHFHEVGAVDSIADVLGVSLGLDALGIDRLVCTPPATGSGSVRTAHGVLPVPAPATARLLQGLPVEPGPSSGELTTPTGAALVRANATSFGALPAMVISAVGHGAGSRDLAEAPNVARLILGREAGGQPSPVMTEESVALLETNLDHLSAEAVGFAVGELLAAGALDVWCTPAYMKKQRPAVSLSVLCPPAEAVRFSQRIITLTGTLGVRRSTVTRTVTDREQRVLDTPWGPVRFKIAANRVRPEHDDVARIARETGRGYDEVERDLRSLADT